MALVFLVVACALYLFWSNRRIDVSFYDIAIDDLPPEFSGFTIVQLSDLHDTRFGPKQRRLIQTVLKASPDLCVITGDLIRSKTKSPAAALELIRGLAQHHRVGFITGNHEWQHRDPKRIISSFSSAGAEYVRSHLQIEREGKRLRIYGVDDPRSYGDNAPHAKRMFADRLRSLAKKHRCERGNSEPLILLSHRPDFAESYSEYGYDLVLTGHVHGGVWRLPGSIGLFDPSRKLFPRYSSGRYTIDSTDLIVSRGLGPATIPVRINNSPEIVVITLSVKNGKPTPPHPY